MSTLTLNIRRNKRTPGKISVEMDAFKFERFAASLGLFGHEFLKSLDVALKDVRAGRTKKIKSLRELRT